MRVAVPALPPFQALLAGLVEAGEWAAELAPHAALRRAVIASSLELQERERTKLADVTEALTAVLRERGVATTRARLLAQVGAALFQFAFEQWTERPSHSVFALHVYEAAAELTASLPPSAPPE